MHHLVVQLVLQQLVNQASEVAMQSLVAGNQLIGERKPGHQPTLLQPIDGAEAPAEKDTLHARETDEPLVERAVLVHPIHSPLRLRSNGGNRLDSMEELHPLILISDVLLNEKAVRLRVDILHRHLESVESASLRNLDFIREIRRQVL